MFNSDFWAPKTSPGLQNVFLERSRVVWQNLKFLSKTGLLLVPLAHTLYLTALVKWYFRPFGNICGKSDISLFFRDFQLSKWFLSPQNVPRTPKCISRELSSSLTKSEIFVKNWTFIGTTCPHFVPHRLGKMVLSALWKYVEKAIFPYFLWFSTFKVISEPPKRPQDSKIYFSRALE